MNCFFNKFTDLKVEKFYTSSNVLELSTYITGNNIYKAKGLGFNRAYIYKDSSAKKFQQEIEDLLESLPEEVILDTYCCEFNVLYVSEWFFKNGNIKRIDITNITKTAEDAICSKLGIDDSRFFKSNFEKVIPTGGDYSKSMDIIFEINFFKKSK